MKKFIGILIALVVVSVISFKLFAADKPVENTIALGSFNSIELTANNSLTEVYANVGDKTLVTFELVEFKTTTNTAHAIIKASNGMMCELNVSEGDNKITIDGIRDGKIIVNASVTRSTANYILNQLKNIKL
jgi:penicillin V acylase-like amidase (Ntn superfamily)